MRHWAAEIVAFDPVLSRAMHTLEPLLQLGNLRRMNPAELRQVIRTLNERREVELSGNPEAAQPTAADAAPPVPPIGDSAQAN
jgi:hypothetical protein